MYKKTIFYNRRCSRTEREQLYYKLFFVFILNEDSILPTVTTRKTTHTILKLLLTISYLCFKKQSCCPENETIKKNFLASTFLLVLGNYLLQKSF